MAYGGPLVRRIFASSPSFVKDLVATSYGLKQRRGRYGDHYVRQLRFLESSQFWSDGELAEYEIARRDEFVKRAATNIRYYSEQEDFQRVHKELEFVELPILSKERVRDRLVDFYHRDIANTRHRWASTSGTTGKPLTFPLTAHAFQSEYAFRSLHNAWGGVSLRGNDRKVWCAGHPVAHHDRNRPPFWVFDWSNKTLFFSSYHLTLHNLEAYVKRLERFQPVMLAGYPSSLYLLATGYERFGNRKLPLRSIFASSETLLAFQRQKVESVFGVKVFNYYGNTEMSACAMECEKGELHLRRDYSYVEVLNTGNSRCQPGETGRLVCTGFLNDAFPLIRYDVGDNVTLAADQKSKCGRGGLLLTCIDGRVEAYVVTPDHRLVGRLDHIFKEARHVVEAQLVQHRIEEVILRIVKDKAYTTEDEAGILRAAKIRLGSSIQVRIEYVDQIPREDNGKFRFINSTLDHNVVFQDIAI